MSEERFVLNTETNEKVYLSKTERVLNLVCPIDNSKIIAESDFYNHIIHYTCKTCDYHTSLKYVRLSQADLDDGVRNYLFSSQKRLALIDEEKSKLLKVLSLAKKNNFKF